MRRQRKKFLLHYCMVGIAGLVFLLSCTEELILIEQEDRSKLDSLETIIRVIEDDLNVVLAAKSDLQRKVDSLNNLISGQITQPLQDIEYTVQVVDGSTAFMTGARRVGLANALVTISQSETAREFITDDSGMVTFSDMKSGFIALTVEIDGYSDVFMIIDLRDGGDDDNSTSSDNRYAATQVVVFPTEGDNMYTISGTVYYNQTELNDNRDGSQNNPFHPVTGSAVFETAPSVTLLIDCIPAGILNNTSRPGRIVHAVYAGLKRIVTSNGTNGNYSVSLPVVLRTNGTNFFNYSGPFGSSISGQQVTIANGTINQIWVLGLMYPKTLTEIIQNTGLHPGGNSIIDLYYVETL